MKNRMQDNLDVVDEGAIEILGKIRLLYIEVKDSTSAVKCLRRSVFHQRRILRSKLSRAAEHSSTSKLVDYLPFAITVQNAHR